MFISADYYQELYLNEKDENAVLAEVEKIRKEIGKLKNKMESPSYAYEMHPYPSEAETVSKYREYLERALDRLSELRGEEARSEEEIRSVEFNRSLLDISAITLTMGRYLQYKHELSFTENTATLKTFHLDSEPTVDDKDHAECIDSISRLYLGEWKHSYMPVDYVFTVSEATGWQLRIDYKGKKAPVFYDGRGIFPYNFNSLLKLLDADCV